MHYKLKTMNIKIIKTNRNKNVLIPQQLIRNDEILTEGINQYCKKNNLDPIYIDDCVAIFNEEMLIACYEEEV